MLVTVYGLFISSLAHSFTELESYSFTIRNFSPASMAILPLLFTFACLSYVINDINTVIIEKGYVGVV